MPPLNELCLMHRTLGLYATEVNKLYLCPVCFDRSSKYPGNEYPDLERRESSETLVPRNLHRCGNVADMMRFRPPKQVLFAAPVKGGRRSGRFPLGYKDTAEYNI